MKCPACGHDDPHFVWLHDDVGGYGCGECNAEGERCTAEESRAAMTLAAQSAEIAMLRISLLHYGMHRPSCNVLYYEDGTCDCGWSLVMTTLKDSQ